MDSNPHSTERPAVADPRVYLAAERTYLAWVRTSLGLIGFGFLIARFAYLTPISEGRSHLLPYLGFAMVCFGVSVCAASAQRHLSYIGALRAGVENPPRDVALATALALVLAVVGITMAIHILIT
jgi:putative membrane protein